MKHLFRRLRWLVITLLTLGCYLGLSATPVAAHDSIPLSRHRLMEMWDWESWSMVGLVLIAWLYSRGVRILWWRSGVGQGITVGQALAFNGGLTVLFIAFVSPLYVLSADLFIAHTVQHLLLILLAAPLFLLGKAPVALSWAIPKTIQRWWHYWWRKQGDLHLIGRFFLQPRVSWGVYLTSLWLLSSVFCLLSSTAVNWQNPQTTTPVAARCRCVRNIRRARCGCRRRRRRSDWLNPYSHRASRRSQVDR